MRNYFRTLVSTLFVVVGLAVQAQSIFTSKIYKFAVVPPPGWEQKDAADAIVSFLEPIQTAPPVNHGKETNKQLWERVKRSTTGAGSSSGFRSNITISAMPTKVTSILEYVS